MRLSELARRFTSRPDPRFSMRARTSPGARVEIQIMGHGSLDVLLARDISATGVGVFVPHMFAGCNIDDEVELVLTLPRERPFLARGVIRHHTRSDEGSEHFGVMFTDISEEDQDKILRYVEGQPGR